MRAVVWGKVEPRQLKLRHKDAHVTSRASVLALGVVLSVTACSTAQTSDFEPGEEYPGDATTNTLLFGQHALSRHAENMSDEHETMFFSGNAFFNQPWVTAPSSTAASDGLGPMFNARSCSGCHADDGRGRPPLEADEPLLSMLFRIGVGFDAHELPLPDSNYGGQLQPFSLLGVPAEGNVLITWQEQPGEYPDGTSFSLSRPSYELIGLAYGSISDEAVLSPRVAPAMHGLGLLEAVPEERLYELADEDDTNEDGISGRVRLVPLVGSKELVVGRFGWKSEQPSVRQQAAGAFQGDMGLTTSLFGTDEAGTGECTMVQLECAEQPYGAEPGEPEVSDEVLDRVVLYSQTLAVPYRQDAEKQSVLHGKRLFNQLGCAACHTPKHHTGEHEVQELSDQTIYPYTDLLLHDMGELLADGAGETRIEREWRTAPLWGLRYYPAVNGHDRLLHDGRARGVEEAILWHGGEAAAVRDAFMNLTQEERELVVSFVESL